MGWSWRRLTKPSYISDPSSFHVSGCDLCRSHAWSRNGTAEIRNEPELDEPCTCSDPCQISPSPSRKRHAKPGSCGPWISCDSTSDSVIETRLNAAKKSGQNLDASKMVMAAYRVLIFIFNFSL